jgi:hypothetical protein
MKKAESADSKQIMLLEVPQKVTDGYEVRYRAKAQEILLDGSLGEVKTIDLTEETMQEMMKEVKREIKKKAKEEQVMYV